MERQTGGKKSDASTRVIKRAIRDSVFSDLFSFPKYQLQLYQALHPEDTTTAIADIKLCTVKNALVNGLYNDLGLQVGERQIILLESQAKWSPNIVWRVLFYLSETYKRYFQDHEVDLFSPKAASAPKPELYMIYVGDRQDAPERLSLREMFFPDQDCLDLRISVLTGGSGSDIISQYVTFSRTAANFVREYGNDSNVLNQIVNPLFPMGMSPLFLIKNYHMFL